MDGPFAGTSSGKLVDVCSVPAKAGRAGEDIALQIQAAVLDGTVRPGERLPSERELQVLFKTGRGVIREALQVLKHKGLIEIRKGAKGGAFVKNIEVVSVSEAFALFLRQNQTDPNNLIEFRESLDLVITDLAIARGSAEQKQQLVERTETLAKVANCSVAHDASHPEGSPGSASMEGAETLVELDRELNLLFAKMAGNPIFEWIMQAIQSGFSSLDNALYEDAAYRRIAVDNWQNTARAIFQNDPLKAKSFISYHYMVLRQKVDQAHATNDSGVKTTKIQGENWSA
ncbi:MAG: FadR family transcriptional regulator [Desulfovibrionales bacterium]|nr:MAG: FadR family transcriptional regulator [Desulfovibrionales bacterium]